MLVLFGILNILLFSGLMQLWKHFKQLKIATFLMNITLNWMENV